MPVFAGPLLQALCCRPSVIGPLLQALCCKPANSTAAVPEALDSQFVQLGEKKTVCESPLRPRATFRSAIVALVARIAIAIILPIRTPSILTTRASINNLRAFARLAGLC